YDVWRGLDDADAEQRFGQIVETLASNIHRWDLGYWSRYDLYPHPGFVNVASPSYHVLHINQLRVLNRIAPNAELAAVAERFEGYQAKRVNRIRAFVHKGLFRVVVPRNHVLAGRLPWLHGYHSRQGAQATDDAAN